MKKNYLAPTTILAAFDTTCQLLDSNSIEGYSGPLGSRRRRYRKWDDGEEPEEDEDEIDNAEDGASW